MEKAPYLIWSPKPDWFYDLLKGLQKVEGQKRAQARKVLLCYKLDRYERRRTGMPMRHEDPDPLPIIPSGYYR